MHLRQAGHRPKARARQGFLGGGRWFGLPFNDPGQAIAPVDFLVVVSQSGVIGTNANWPSVPAHPVCGQLLVWRVLIRKLVSLSVALGCFAVGAGLSWQHPLWPWSILSLLFAWCAAVAWRPSLWLFAVPAFMPVLNLSPWTGWLVVDEFDIFLLATLAGAYVNRLLDDRASTATRARAFFPLWMTVIGLAGLCGLLRGFLDAGSFSLNWFADYAAPSNSLRVFKSLGFALLFAPLLHSEVLREEAKTCRLFASGMLAGLTLVVAATLWERATFPGLINFSSQYRTVALFWEMHVGGAAIDTYLALSSPFAVWALMQARRPLSWLGAAILTLLVVYANLTTFSRGVYLAVATPLLLLAMLLWINAHDGRARVLDLGVRLSPWFLQWRARAGAMLSVVLLMEVVAVLAGGSFMTDRLADTGRDLSSRLQHWKYGLGLLQTPGDAFFGIGLGRLPANYAARVPAGEFPGQIRWNTESNPGELAKLFVTLNGPPKPKKVRGNLELTQQVYLGKPGMHRVHLEVRVQHVALMAIRLCERHLLYDRACELAYINLKPAFVNNRAVWQPLVIPLTGSHLSRGSKFVPRSTVFSLGLAGAGTHADIDQLSLMGPDGVQLLRNGDFSLGPAHWFPAARSNFEPWHLDNLYLEVLVERGLLGLVLLLLPVAYAMWHLIIGYARLNAISAYIAAALLGVLLVGLVSSVMDVPRVAFLFYLLTLLGGQLTTIATKEELPGQSPKDD